MPGGWREPGRSTNIWSHAVEFSRSRFVQPWLRIVPMAKFISYIFGRIYSYSFYYFLLSLRGYLQLRITATTHVSKAQNVPAMLCLKFVTRNVNPLNPELNPICYLLALLGAHHFPYVSRIRVKLLTFRPLMSYIYGAPILDVSRSHTTTQHSR